MENKIYKMTVTGLVQGIGFRPFIAELAEEYHLSGQVKNLGGVVEIIFSGNDRAVDGVLQRLREMDKTKELPGCRIDSMELEELDMGKQESSLLESFRIVESNTGREVKRFLPTDLPTCDRCVAEMHDASNRRYRYPFISCTACGPRFSIQKQVPYDRETITMDDFKMCAECYDEYTEKGNIRRHAQTIACKDCGPKLTYVSYEEETKQYRETAGEEESLSLAIHALKQGKIGAIKDIGGYHFALLPTNAEAAMRLRKFKHRDKKPFAVMFPDMDSIREYCKVCKEEEELLLSQARPIVLLEKIKDFVPEICGESDRIGALLPCNPLQILLLEETGPLVMTSGNKGGEPIIIDEEEMKQHLGGQGIDFMLTHDREILTPLDDSIYQVARWGNEIHPQLIRRARGLVPDPITLKRKLKKDIFAAGGDLKASFALGREELVYMSQYFGDLDEVRCMDSRKRGRKRMEELLEVHPKSVIADMHPRYVSVEEARQEAENLKGRPDDGRTIKQIQHHHAHIASVMAEQGLEGKILGIACDGTGYGTDGTIWGSEFLLCEEDKMQRVGHLSSVKLLGGDAGAKQADMTLFSYMMEAKECGYDVEEFFDTFIADAQEEKRAQLTSNYHLQGMAWKQNINTAYSSSMGRLFDAVAALLDICHENSYEGLCAIQLEQAAHKGKTMLAEHSDCAEYSGSTGHDESAEKRDVIDNILSISCNIRDGIWQADGVKLLVDLYHLKSKYPKEVLAYLFHHAISEAMVEIAEQISKECDNMKGVALSGGSFVNRILLQEVMCGLKERGMNVYINEKVPCQDGGIALGQSWLATF